jgi:hypothetical protein
MYVVVTSILFWLRQRTAAAAQADATRRSRHGLDTEMLQFMPPDSEQLAEDAREAAESGYFQPEATKEVEATAAVETAEDLI